MHRLAIRHETRGTDHWFAVQRVSGGGRAAEPIILADPMERPLGGTELSFGGELRWYLEHYLSYPYGVNAERAERVMTALQAWGAEAFAALFGSGDARDFYRDASRDGHNKLQIQIFSDTPAVLAWPWEALRDPQVGNLAHLCRMERCLDRVPDPPTLPDNLPEDRIGILLVTARPYRDDIAYRSVSRPLIEMISKRELAAEVTVLRPPTFKQLQQELGDNPGAYHIVHFDGHGGFGSIGAGSDQFRGKQGRLVFEDDEGEPDEITGEQLSQLLREHRIPIAVLNACQSAMIDAGSDDAFASVAASLLRAGVRSVVAMGYSLYVSAAREFLPAFYERLFAAGDVAEAVRAGRHALLGSPERRPGFALADWLVPVLYQQQPLTLDFVRKAVAPKAPQTPQIAAEALLGRENPYGLIGRDSAVLALERASHRPPAGLLVHGHGGVGKTTLARGYIEWMAQTGGLEHSPIWLSFVDIRSADYVFNRLVEAVFGINAVALPDSEKWPALVKALRNTPFLIIWDNFESASGAAGQDLGAGGSMPPADLERLRAFLEDLRGGRTNVLITSRDTEDWLGVTACYRVPLGGLAPEERIELARAILNDQGVRYDPSDEDAADLVDSLQGHPLMMRAILPKLGKQSAASLMAALDAYAPEANSTDPLEQRLFAMFRFVEDGLPAALRPLLYPIGLHVGHVQADYLAGMAQVAEQPFTIEEASRTLALLQGAGLAQHVGNDAYALHPGLTRYIRTRTASLGESDDAAKWREGFVEAMTTIASFCAPLPLHEQRNLFHLFGASFEHALELAGDNFEACSILVQAFGSYAYHRRNLPLAERHYEALASHCEMHGAERDAATAYHQLGIVAQLRHNLEAAEKWYMKSLAVKERLGDELDAASTYHHLGMLAQERRDMNAAEKWYMKSLAIKEPQGDERGASGTYNQLGNLAQMRRDFDAAEKWYTKSIAIKERLGDEYGAAGTYHQLGIVADDRHDFEAAEKWYTKSLAIRERIGDEQGAADTYHQLGMMAQERHDFDAAEKWYTKSLAIEEQLGNELGAAISYHQLGVFAQMRLDLDAAEKWYMKSIAGKMKLGDDHGVATTYHQLGILAHDRKDFDTAEELFAKSLLIKERLGDEHGSGSTYFHLGKLAQSRAESDVAEALFVKALEIFERLNDPRAAGIVRHNLDRLRGS